MFENNYIITYSDWEKLPSYFTDFIIVKLYINTSGENVQCTSYLIIWRTEDMKFQKFRSSVCNIKPTLCMANLFLKAFTAYLQSYLLSNPTQKKKTHHV